MLKWQPLSCWQRSESKLFHSRHVDTLFLWLCSVHLFFTSSLFSSSWFMLSLLTLSLPSSRYIGWDREKTPSPFQLRPYSWVTSANGREAGLLLRIGRSFYLFKQSQGRQEEDRFATSNELQTIPHPPLTWLRSYFPLSTLLLTTLPLCKSFLGFVLKGQGSQKGGATKLEKIPTSNYTGAHVPGLTCLPTLGGHQLATGTQLGLLDSWPWQLQK